MAAPTSVTSPQSLADMDRRFAGSGRRSAARRARRSWRRAISAAAWRAAAGAVACIAGLVALVEGGRALERALDDPGTPAAAVAAPPAPPCPVPAEFRDDFSSASRRTGVPVPLLVAMAYEESRMDPHARSRAGAEGLLQLMPATAQELGLDPRVSRSNVLAGARYLRRMLRRFDRLDLALSAYNAGPSAVERSGAAPWPVTGAYVTAVRTRAAALSSCR